MLQIHSQLLGCNVERLLRRVDLLQKLLAVDQDTAVKVIVKAPRILTTSLDHLRENLVNLQQQLASVGLLDQEIHKVLLKSPQLLLQNRVNLTTKLQALKLLGLAEADLLKLLVNGSPTFLTLTPDTLTAKIDFWAEELGWDRHELRGALASNSRVLMLDATLVVDFIRHLTRLAEQSQVWSRRQSPQWKTKLLQQHCSQRGQVSTSSSITDDDDGSSRINRPNCWQVYFARNISGRLLLRLEFLLAFGMQEEVTLNSACKKAATQWAEQFPGDNTIAQTQKNDQAIREELAKELCKVPKSAVSTRMTMNKSTMVNTESWGYYICDAKSTAEAGQIITRCNNKKFQEEFMDELEDRTTPDHEAEKIECVLKAGVPPKGPTAGRRLMA
eukprot:gene11165-11315_t